jgi:Na+/melibiose symporter-like transporter
VILAAILGVGTIAPHAVLLRRRPEDLGLGPDGLPPLQPKDEEHARSAMQVGEAMRHVSFRWLSLGFWLATLATAAVGIHILPYLQGLGYDATFAATVTGAIGAMQVLARLLLAPFGNRIKPRVLAASILALQPLSLLVLLLARSTPGVLLFVILFGAQRGLSTLARPAMLADLYGAAQFASIAGVLQFLLSLAQAAAPFGAGVAYDALHSYEPVLWTLTLVSGLAVLAILPARRPASNQLKSEP